MRRSTSFSCARHSANRETNRSVVQRTSCQCVTGRYGLTMRLRAGLVALVALLLPVLIAHGAPAATASSTTAAPAYGHAGRWITDTQGRVVIQHGVNMVNKIAPYTQEAVGFGDDDA